MTSVAMTEKEGHSVRLIAALCGDGAPAVSIAGLRSKQTGRNVELGKPRPGGVFLRPGMYVIDAHCERNRAGCGLAEKHAKPAYSPRALMTYFKANESKRLDCDARTGELFVTADMAK